MRYFWQVAVAAVTRSRATPRSLSSLRVAAKLCSRKAEARRWRGRSRADERETHGRPLSRSEAPRLQHALDDEQPPSGLPCVASGKAPSSLSRGVRAKKSAPARGEEGALRLLGLHALSQLAVAPRNTRIREQK